MDIKKLYRPKKGGVIHGSSKRCEHRVDCPTSTGNWGSEKSRCCKHAQYRVDGKFMCKLHAGGYVLDKLLEKQ